MDESLRDGVKWLRGQGSNLEFPESKSGVFPLDHPASTENMLIITQSIAIISTSISASRGNLAICTVVRAGGSSLK